MAVALRGDLRDFGMGEVFQLIGQQRKTGILEVSRGNDRIRIAFDQGSVVSGEQAGPYPYAAVGDMLVRTGLVSAQRLLELENECQQSGAALPTQLVASGDLEERQVEELIDLVRRDAIFALLRWTEGSFHFSSQAVPHDRSEAHLLPAEQILMDGLRMLDEWRTFDPAATRDDSVFQRCGRFEAVREAWTHASPEQLSRAERLFLTLDGRSRTRRVVELSRMGDFEAARWLSELRLAGVIEPLDPALVARSRRLLPLALATGPSPLAAVFAVAPFLLLGALLLSLFAHPPLLAPPRLAPDAETAARQVFEARRLRNQVEAWRFARGRWPRDLDEVQRLGPGRDFLATSPTRPYYYASRGDTFLVLAPEQ